MENKRFVNIQALRGMAVLIVLGRHMQICIERLLGKSLFLDCFVLGDIGVDLFFVVSGFVMVISTRQQFLSWRDARTFLYHRATRIYPLYWLYSLPAIWVYWYHSEWLHRYDKGLEISAMKSLLLWPQRSLPMLGQGWSLTFELYYYVVFAALLFVPRRYFLKALLFWGLGVVVLNACIIFGLDCSQLRPEWWIVWNLPSVEFIAGAVIGVGVVEGWLSGPGVGAGWLSFGSAFAWALLVLLPEGVELINNDRVFGYGLPAFALVYGAVVLELNRVRLPLMLDRIGKYSYSIYLSHILVLSALVRFWPWRRMSGPVAEVGLIVLMLFLVVGYGAVSYHFLEQPMLAWSRRWLPDRRRPAKAAPPAAVPASTLNGEVSAAS